MKKKSIINFILVMFILICTKVYAAEPQLTIEGHGIAKAGETKTITVKVKSDTYKVGTIIGKIETDAKIEKIQVGEDGEGDTAGLKGWSITYNPDTKLFIAYKASGANYSDVMQFSYTVKAGEIGNATVTITGIEMSCLSNGEYIIKNISNVTKNIIIEKEQEVVIKEDIKKTEIKPPKKVAGFKVKSQKTDQINLTWSKQQEITGYKVYSYNYKKEKWEYVGKTGKTSYTVKKLKAGTTYKYRVRAYRTIDKKQYYGSYSSSLKTTTKPSSTKITSLKSKSKKVTLKWKKVSGVSGYQIYMASSKNGKYSKIKTISKGKTNSYTKTKLKKKKKYYFKIRSYKILDGKKVYSSYSSIKYIKVK